MKQLINIPAKFLQKGDFIFDYKTRVAEEVDYVAKETEGGKTDIKNIFVSYGLESMVADNFSPNDEVTILVDTNDIKIRLVQQ